MADNDLIERPERIWIWFADNGNIRKWQREPFPEGTEFVLASASRSECEGLRAAGGDAEKALREAKETLTDLDARLIECGALHTAEDAYDTSYRGSVLDALISIDIVLDTLPAALSQKETGDA